MKLLENGKSMKVRRKIKIEIEFMIKQIEDDFDCTFVEKNTSLRKNKDIYNLPDCIFNYSLIALMEFKMLKELALSCKYENKV